MHGRAPWRFLKLSSLRRARPSSADSRTHSLCTWLRCCHLIRYSGSCGVGSDGGGGSPSAAAATVSACDGGDGVGPGHTGSWPAGGASVAAPRPVRMPSNTRRRARCAARARSCCSAASCGACGKRQPNTASTDSFGPAPGSAPASAAAASPPPSSYSA
eukprot:353527-Chlamydomonas_euryale.AAC.2